MEGGLWDQYIVEVEFMSLLVLECSFFKCHCGSY